MLLGRMEAEDEDVDAPPSCIGVLAQLMTSECCCSSHAHSPRLASHPVDVGTGMQPERSWLRRKRISRRVHQGCAPLSRQSACLHPTAIKSA